MEEKGVLTEKELISALDEISDPRDKIEIRKIFSNLNSVEAHVNLKTFKQKVIQYNQKKLEQDKENCNDTEFQNIMNHVDSKLTFHPHHVSSPMVSKRDFLEPQVLSIHEETFEDHGAEDNSLEDSEFSHSRPSHLRLSFRRSRGLSRRHSNISASESSSPNIEDEVEHLKKQLCDKQDLVQKCEEELMRESELVKTLEDKVDNTENDNKELRYELENSKINIKNLEAHMIFLDEKLTSDQKEMETQRLNVSAERERLLAEKKKHLSKEIEHDRRVAEFEEMKGELVSQNHILQSIIQELREENKRLADNLESITKSSAEEIKKLMLENIARKQTRTCQNNNHEKSCALVVEPEEEKRKKRLLVIQLLKKVMFRSGLLCIREILIYLKFMLSN